MEKQKRNRVLETVKIVLSIMIAASFLFFIIGEIALPPENNVNGSYCETYTGEWVRIQEDGSVTPAVVPGQNAVEWGQWATVETVLPEDLDANCFCLRSLQQDFRVYVDGVLRKEYSTVDTQPFGKTSTIAYVFVPLELSDAGKTVRVEFMTRSSYAGYMDGIFIGERSDIVSHLLDQYMPGLVVAIMIFALGITVFLFALWFEKKNQKETELRYLGVIMILASTWLLSESKLRQFYWPHSTVAVYLGFFMIMLLPYPFLAYINQVQKRRHEKACTVVLVAAAVNFVICTTLQVLNIKDFFETMVSSHIILGVTIGLMFVSIMMDIKSNHVKTYSSVALGFGCIVIGGILEVLLTYSVTTKANGIPLCLSLVGLLVGATIKLVNDMANVERERQIALTASRSKAAFLANMSHEIRTPINTMLGMNEMILRESKDETITDYAGHIKNSGHVLLGIINDVLDFSKIEAGKLVVVTQPYELRMMLEDVEVGMKERMRNKGLTFSVETEDALPAVLKGDEIRIRQILNNLLSNALKYTEKGSVKLSAQGKNTENGFILVLKVADTGCGINPEDREKLFESFSRLEVQKNRHIQGTGLGLTITKQLVDTMGGVLDVTSTYGEGSCFIVEIPQEIVSQTLSDKEADAEIKASSAEETSEKKEFFYAPDAKVLVVDDNDLNRMVAKALLKRTGMQIDFAVSGVDCLEKTREKQYDLILMDHMMPDMDGIETYHRLQAEEENVNKNTKVVVLTANAVDGAERMYREEGFADYLAKPMEPDKAEAVLRKFLADKEQH